MNVEPRPKQFSIRDIAVACLVLGIVLASFRVGSEYGVVFVLQCVAVRAMIERSARVYVYIAMAGIVVVLAIATWVVN